MSNQVFLFKAVYGALCTVTVFLDCVITLWVYLSSRFVYLYHAYVTNDCEYIFKNAKNVCKIPTHLTILLGNELPSYNDLANLVMWSMTLGIQFISFYDHKGILKKSEDKFQAAVEKRKADSDHIIWHDSENSYKNGFVGQTIHVRTLSANDGRYNIADVVRDVSNNQSDTINQPTIDSHLQDSFKFPDPDLGLSCGEPLCVYGFPPWQMRITEFIQIGTHIGISRDKFVEILHRFSKTEQRLGK